MYGARVGIYYIRNHNEVTYGENNLILARLMASVVALCILVDGNVLQAGAPLGNVRGGPRVVPLNAHRDDLVGRRVDLN